MFLNSTPLLRPKMPLDPASPDFGPAVDTGVVVLMEDQRILLPDGRVLLIRAGFDFDGISVPRLFWSSTYHPFHLRTMCAGLAHDALYAAELLPRDAADRIFAELLDEAGVSWYTENKMWLGVRAGGGFVWRDHTRAEVAYYRTLVQFEEVAV